MDFLCRFATRFPLLVAQILESDRHKRRNFREETITDILMAGLVPFEPFHIITNYPQDESVTGEDMDWEFVNEHAVDGRRYLRLHIQAKRASWVDRKNPYWQYRELDHAAPKKVYGGQHTRLIDEASKIPGCVALYMFYHPESALTPASKELPAVDGVNWMFADQITKKISSSRWPVADKKLERWRPHFHPLSDLLCFGRSLNFVRWNKQDDTVVALLISPQSVCPTPGEIADRLNERVGQSNPGSDRASIKAVEEIPASTLATVREAREGQRISEVKRPRVIFVSDSMWRLPHG